MQLCLKELLRVRVRIVLESKFDQRVNEKKLILQQKTDDVNIINNAKITALTQEDLADLIDIKEPIIYLCGEKFIVPIRVTNKHYIGILGKPSIGIETRSQSELDARHIIFENVSLPWGIIKSLDEDVSKFQGCKIAAEAGDKRAMYALALMYLYGEDGASKDFHAANDWFRRAADANVAEAIRMVGECYEEGWGCYVDRQAAIRWYKFAAEAGDPKATLKLSKMYINGEDVDKDYGEALKWLFKAAGFYDADAMQMLGDCYRYGYGTYKDVDTAIRWYEKAIRAGSDTAKKFLDELYSEKDEDGTWDSKVYLKNNWAEIKVAVKNKSGIYNRPAAKIVEIACKYRSKIQLLAGNKVADAKSIMSLLDMGNLAKGTKLIFRANGPDEIKSVTALKDLINSKFGEE